MKTLQDRIKQTKVTVIGDLILDKYIFTDVNRISPEAPIPIAEYKSENYILGGAANVAINLRNLGAQVTLIGTIGKDQNGELLSNYLEKSNIRFLPIITDYKTTTKTRFIANKHQLLRLDYEDRFNDSKVSETLIKGLESVLSSSNLLIVSDYNKGVITGEVLEYIKRLNIYKVGDLKPRSYQDLTGFNFIKPNFNEALEISRLLGNNRTYKNTSQDIRGLGQFLKSRIKSDILITRGSKGVSYIGDIIYEQEINDSSDVIDVTGAGDTSLSTFSLLDYLGVKKQDSLKYMNKAASLTVSKLGTYAPSFDEVFK